MLGKVSKEQVMAAYGLGSQKYFQQLKDGMEAEKSDITGQVYPDHKTRRAYHEVLGKMLGLEKDGVQVVAPTQNNYYNLSDEQLDQLIEAKLRQTRAGDVAGRETEADTRESVEVSPTA